MPLAILAATVLIVLGGRLLVALQAPRIAIPEVVPQGAVDQGGDAPAQLDPLTPAGVAPSSADLERIRANITFWGEKLTADDRDFVSASRLAGSQIELARATGDLGAYLAAGTAIDRALVANPDYGLARDYHGVILVALHHFADARSYAVTVLADQPKDAAALATLGDAALELGDVAAARTAYATLARVADGAAARVRESHLAFIEGRTTDAVAFSRSALAAATAEGAVASGLAWYHYQLGDTLIATGDRAGAATAYADALAADPTSHLAHWGLARVAAAGGRIDDAITQLDAAIAVVPLPEFVARRADLYEMRGAAGDAGREAADRKTVLAIAQLNGEASGVYDRTLSLYLASTAIEPARALSLAEAEIAIRKDVYGYDALAWALLANGRTADADAAMQTALAFGTRDAKLLYHAGIIAAAVGDQSRARSQLSDALALDASFDPMGAQRARDTLSTLP
jgi:tetratricopeptide (TPR) repeat protein